MATIESTIQDCRDNKIFARQVNIYFQYPDKKRQERHEELKWNGSQTSLLYRPPTTTMSQFGYVYETLHIALVSLPQNDAENQAQLMVDHLYTPYKKNIDEFSNSRDAEDDHLYKPLKYFLFGHYDIALISLVNNY